MENILDINDDFEKEVEYALNGRENIIHRIRNMFPDNKTIPSKEANEQRKFYNEKPLGNLICINSNESYYRIFTDDENGWVWYEMPWYHHMFYYPFQKMKLVHFDNDHVKNAKGSSEIYVIVSDIVQHKNNIQSISKDKMIWNEESYNFRDLSQTNCVSHFFADIVPKIIY